jgi:hypothetical protein
VEEKNVYIYFIPSPTMYVYQYQEYTQWYVVDIYNTAYMPPDLHTQMLHQNHFTTKGSLRPYICISANSLPQSTISAIVKMQNSTTFITDGRYSTLLLLLRADQSQRWTFQNPKQRPSVLDIFILGIFL